MRAALKTIGGEMESNHRLLVQDLLIEWAKWQSYQSGVVKGYPMETPFYRMMRSTAVRDAMISDEVAVSVDRAVAALDKRSPTLAKVLRMNYLNHDGYSAIGREIKESRDEVKRMLRQAETAIEYTLEPENIW